MSWGKSLWVPTIAGIQLFQQPSAKWVRCITLVSSHGCQAKTHGTVQPVGQFFLWNSRHLLAVLLFLAAWMRSSMGPSAMQNQPCTCRPWWAWWPKPTRMPERRMGVSIRQSCAMGDDITIIIKINVSTREHNYMAKRLRSPIFRILEHDCFECFIFN